MHLWTEAKLHRTGSLLSGSFLFKTGITLLLCLHEPSCGMSAVSRLCSGLLSSGSASDSDLVVIWRLRWTRDQMGP